MDDARNNLSSLARLRAAGRISGPNTVPRATILVANDQEWAARSLESILVGEGYAVVRAYTGRQALDGVAAANPTAIILDLQMPDLGGLEVCEALRSDPSFDRATPIFITTAGPSGRQERFAAYRAGAWEFFGHPLDPEAILLKLNLFLEARRAIDSGRHDSLIDSATGLYNTRGLARRGIELASHASRRQESVTCVGLTADDADQAPLGEADGLARRIGDLLRKTGRASDAIGRIGPLRFVVLAVGPGEEIARNLTQRVHELSRSAPGSDGSGARGFALRVTHWPLAAGGDFSSGLDPALEPAGIATGPTAA